MNRKILLAMVGVIALVVTSASAAAQATKPVGLSIRAGAAFPTNRFSGENSTWFAAGAEFNLSNAGLGNLGMSGLNGHLAISADYRGRSNSYAIPVLLNWVGTEQQVFYSLGAGASFDHPGFGSSNKTDFGYQVGVGYNFVTSQTPLFLEAKYWGTSGNSHLNAIGVYVGIRL